MNIENKKTALIFILLFVVALLLFSSCKKEPITPGNYQPNVVPIGTTNPSMTNGGTTPTWTTSSTSNGLVGKKFLVADYKIALTSQAINNDTIYFINTTQYKVGYLGNVYTYNFYPTSYGNATFVLNSFSPATSLSLSAIIGDNTFTNTNWSLNAQRTLMFRVLPTLEPTIHYFTFKRVN